MIDVLILIVIAFIAVMFCEKNSSPKNLDKILYNSEFNSNRNDSVDSNSDDSISHDDSNHENTKDSGSSSGKDIHDDVNIASATKGSNKKEYIEEIELEDGYSEEEIKMSSRSLIKEILARE